ncbi:MAG: winged helix-turn-helix transcriptional regulator [Candidatus Thorarchaeota archaeon]|nr:winged helix-turn-helix transcriptional regulator [Candidatus Thorarchaeota archaeon]
MHGPNPLETLKILTGEQAIDAYKALSDEHRRQILHALRARRMSTSELVEFLSAQDPEKEVKPQTVRYHIKELEKCGLVEQDGYEPAGNGDSHIMQKLWRATAENVFITTGNMDGLPTRNGYDLDKTLDIVATMKNLGLQFESEDEIREIADAMTLRDRIYLTGLERAKESLKEACEIDPALYVVFRRILSVVRLNQTDYEEYWKSSRKITDGLREAYRRGEGKNPRVY